MTLQELRYIIALADTGNFQRAAVQCHISQPTLSQQVKKLEEYLGVVLFDRSLRRIVSTVVGVQVVASARLMIEEANRIREIARGGLDPMRRTLKLGVIPTVGPYLLPRILGAIHRTHPALRLLLREEFTNVLLDKLESGAFDGAIIALPLERDGLRAEPLFDEPFFAALPRNHALAVDAASVKARSNAVVIRPFRKPAPRRRIGLVWRQCSPAEATLLTLAVMEYPDGRFYPMHQQGRKNVS